MGLETMETGISIWKGLKFSISTCYRSVRNHPFVLGIMLFFFILNRFLPSVFGLLVSSSPILVCTVVFLRTILSFGHPNIHNVEEEEKTHEISTLKDHRSIKEKIIEEGGVSKGRVAKRSREEEDGVFSTIHDDVLIGRNVMIVDKPKEIQKLLDPKPSQPALIFHNDSDATLELSHNSNFVNGDLEAESQEEADDEDEEHGEQEDGIKAVAWTEDDEKNLMDLGTSERERNRRLETLIAKRRARKLSKMQAEKNLIDLDSDVPPGQIATISTARSNPFDIPYNSNETQGLPPLPVSAPSVLLPNQNPFDLPYEPLEEKPNLMGGSFQQEFMAVQQKDMCFCRHESFSSATSFLGELKQDMRDTKLSHCLVNERRAWASEGPGYPIFHGQLGEMGDSKVSSAPEIEPLSSIADQENHEKIIKQQLSQEGEPISHTDNALDHVEQESQPSEQVIVSMETNQEKKRDVDLSLVEIKGEDKEISHDMELRLADTSEVHVKPEVANEEYSKSSSSSSSEVNEQTFNANKDEGLENLELTTMDDYKNVIRNPMQTSLTDLDPKYSVVEVIDDSNTKEPLYDSSPSANEKATIFHMDKEVFLTSTFSIASDLQVEVSEVGSPPVPIERTNSFMDGEEFSLYDGSTKKEFDSGDNGVWTHEIDEKESRSREATDISEHDILRVGFSGVNQNSDDPIASAGVPESVVEQISIESSSSSSPRTELPERPVDQVTPLNSDPKIHVEVQQFEVEKTDPMSPEDLISPEREKVQDLMEKSTSQPSSEGDSDKPQESSNRPGKFIEEANTIYNVNELAVHENEDMENLKPIEDMEGESQVLIKHEAVVHPSKPAEGSDTSKSIEDIDSKSGKMTEYEAVVNQSKPAEESDNSRSFEDFEGESQIITKPDLSITAEESDNSKSIDQTEGKSEKMAEYKDVENLSKPADNSRSIEDGEGESQIIIKHRPVMNLSVTAEESDNSRSIEGKSEKMTEYEVIVKPLKPAEESDNSRSTKDAKGETGKWTENEAVEDPSKPMEEKDNLNCIEDVEGETQELLK